MKIPVGIDHHYRSNSRICVQKGTTRRTFLPRILKGRERPLEIQLELVSRPTSAPASVVCLQLNPHASNIRVLAALKPLGSSLAATVPPFLLRRGLAPSLHNTQHCSLVKITFPLD